MKPPVFGGVAGGASAAARSRRLSEDTEIILFERGPDASFADRASVRVRLESRDLP